MPELQRRRIMAGTNPEGERQALLQRMGVTTQLASAFDVFSNIPARMGFGTPSLAEGATYELERLSYNYWLLITLYRNHWITRRIVDTPSQDMVRAWPKLTSDISPEELTKIDRRIRHTQTKTNLLQSLKWARLFGGAGALIVVDGQEDNLEEPLDLDAIGIGDYKGLIPFDRWVGIQPYGDICTDINRPVDFNKPQMYQVSSPNADSFLVHSSRVLRFLGPEVPTPEYEAQTWWGISVIEPAFEEIRKRDNMSWNILSLTFRACILGIEWPELAQAMSGVGMNQGAATGLMQRMSMINHLLSNQSMLPLPKGGKIDSINYTFSGLSDVYQQFQLDISGATQIPVTRLWGRTITGLGQANDADERIYEEKIATDQDVELRPQLEKLFPVICMSELGDVPKDLDLNFPSVRVLDEKEKVELAKGTLDTVAVAMNLGIMSPRTGGEEVKQASDKTGFGTNLTDERIAQLPDEVQQMGEQPGGGGLEALTGESGEQGEGEKEGGEAGGEDPDDQRLKTMQKLFGPQRAEKRALSSVARAADAAPFNRKLAKMIARQHGWGYRSDGYADEWAHPEHPGHGLRFDEHGVHHSTEGDWQRSCHNHGLDSEAVLHFNDADNFDKWLDLFELAEPIGKRQYKPLLANGGRAMDSSKYKVVTPCYASVGAKYQVQLRVGETLEWIGSESSGSLYERSNGDEVFVDRGDDDRCIQPDRAKARDDAEASKKAWERRRKGLGPREDEPGSGRGGGEEESESSGEGGEKTSHLQSYASREEWPEHAKSLKIPPAWKDVRISPSANADLLATGLDSKGRKQYVYSPTFKNSQADLKFQRVQALQQNMSLIDKQLDSFRKSRDPKMRDHADCMLLVRKTGIRPGSEADTGGAVQAYGASTLKGHHVWQLGDSTRLRFVGKKGVTISLPVEDAGLASMLRERRAKAGDKGQLFPSVSDSSLRDFTHDSLDHGGFKTKDFRTALAAETAQGLVSKQEAPTNAKEYKKAVMAVAKAVSEKLGNTPTVALQSYIPPQIFTEWKVASEGGASGRATDSRARDKADPRLPDVHYGTGQQVDDDWRDYQDDFDDVDDDEQLERTPDSVVDMLGFDPIDEDGDEDEDDDPYPGARASDADDPGVGEFNLHGLTCVVETPKGNIRSGKGWSVRMPAHYGYIEGYKGADGDSMDCYVADGVGNGWVYVVDQAKLDDPSKFDEHKCMMNFRSMADAVAAYRKGHHRSKDVLIDVTPMPAQSFKQWLDTGNMKKPISQQ